MRREFARLSSFYVYSQTSKPNTMKYGMKIVDYPS